MATSYPGAIDTLTNPTSTDYQDTVDHAAQHTNANDAIEAIQTELGADVAGPNTDVKTRLDNLRSGKWAPDQLAYVAMAYDPLLCTTQTALGANGTVYVTKLWVPVGTITNIVCVVGTAGATLTANQCYAALYNDSKAFVDKTANQATAWTSTGLKTMALGGGAYSNTTARYMYVVFWANGTTRPAFIRAPGGNAAINGALSAANARWASANTGITTTEPATLGTFTATAVPYWAALS